MERKLVTIRQVENILPIQGADFIEVACIDGWETIVKKGVFKIGDYGIYFEDDSFLPIEERYEFLRKSSYKKLIDGSEGFRLKIVKMKGQISQGLLLPLKDFPEISIEFDIDLSEKLNVKKWEPNIPVQLRGLVKGNFPSFIKKTDEERIQNLSKYFYLYKGVSFEATEKLDGTSLTIYLNNGDFGVCSRNLDLKEGEDSYWNLVKKLNIQNILKQFNRNIAIQGEMVGLGINNNWLLLNSIDFYIFNIWDIDLHKYLVPKERRYLVSEVFKLKHVPVIEDSINIFDECLDKNSILAKSEIKSLINPKVNTEGIVYKSCDLIDDQIISFKVVSNLHLLKVKD